VTYQVLQLERIAGPFGTLPKVMRASLSERTLKEMVERGAKAMGGQ